MSAYEKITARIIEIIETEGVLPWRRPWTSQAPRNLRGNAYRGINRLILSLAPYSDPRWLTFNQIRELGGHVVKAQKATPVVFWREVEKADDTLWLSRLYYVFNAAQTEGLNLTPTQSQKREGSSNEVALIENLVRGMSPAPRLEPGSEAYYVPSTDLIVMPRPETFSSSAAYSQVLAHEAAHACGHSTRLNRPGVMTSDGFGKEGYSAEELLAELASCFVCADLGIANDLPQSAAYLQSWLSTLKSDSSLLPRAASQAQKSADFIFGRNHAESLQDDSEAAA